MNTPFITYSPIAQLLKNHNLLSCLTQKPDKKPVNKKKPADDQQVEQTKEVKDGVSKDQIKKDPMDYTQNYWI